MAETSKLRKRATKVDYNATNIHFEGDVSPLRASPAAKKKAKGSSRKRKAELQGKFSRRKRAKASFPRPATAQHFPRALPSLVSRPAAFTDPLAPRAPPPLPQ